MNVSETKYIPNQLYTWALTCPIEEEIHGGDIFKIHIICNSPNCCCTGIDQKPKLMGAAMRSLHQSIKAEHKWPQLDLFAQYQ
jgi:hypothetical protein